MGTITARAFFLSHAPSPPRRFLMECLFPPNGISPSSSLPLEKPSFPASYFWEPSFKPSGDDHCRKFFSRSPAPVLLPETFSSVNPPQRTVTYLLLYILYFGPISWPSSSFFSFCSITNVQHYLVLVPLNDAKSTVHPEMSAAPNPTLGHGTLCFRIFLLPFPSFPPVPSRFIESFPLGSIVRAPRLVR